MTSARRFVEIALLSAVTIAAAAIPARASTIVLYDNYTGVQDGGFAAWGTNNFGGLYVASAFTPSASAQFDSVTIPADYYGGNSSWIIYLTTDAAGLPSTTNLETIPVTLPFTSGGPSPNVTIASSLHTPLTAGTQYWIVLGADPSNPDGLAEWAEQKGGGLGAQTVSGTYDWQIASNANINAPSLHVEGLVRDTDDGAAVPEPTSLVLLGTGIAAGAYRLRRKAGA